MARIAATLDAGAVGASIGRHAVAATPELAGRQDEDLEQETAVAAASNVRAVLDGLTRGEMPSDAVAPPESVAWVSTLVHRGIGASAIPRCYCIGQADLDVALRDAAQAQDMPFDEKWRLAGAMSRFLFGYVEKVVGDLIEHYERERDRWLRGVDSARTELVLAIVEGRRFDPISAAARLRYDLTGRHVALIVWADPTDGGPCATTALRDVAARLARTLGGDDVLVVEAGQSVVWAWTTGEHVEDAPAGEFKVDAGQFAAVGGPGRGPGGFTRSHHQARRARRVMTLMSEPGESVVRHRAVGLSSLLTSDATAAAEFVADELGPLAEDSEANRRLRETLAAFFEEGQSWGRTARRLGVHQNTVIYRVRRVEELLGRPVSERRLELEAALRLADLRGGPAW